jgi:hypothetical protein
MYAVLLRCGGYELDVGLGGSCVRGSKSFRKEGQSICKQMRSLAGKNLRREVK